MRKKRVLAAILLLAVFCFVVSGVGYGTEVQVLEINTPHVGFFLLEARVEYMMHNPTSFLDVSFHYDLKGTYYRSYDMEFPEHVDTEGKLYVEIRDRRGVFSGKSGVTLLEIFKKQLEVAYSFIPSLYLYGLYWDIDEDVVAKFYSKGDIPLGYFYQGEYRLWKE